MLAILSTHPIQYQVPLWQALAKDGRVPFEVWYVSDRHTKVSHDQEFGRTFAWDIDTLEGYPYRFLKSVPGAVPSAFWQCRLTESLADRLKSSNVRALWVQGWQVSAYWQAVFAAHRAGVDLWMRGESNDLKPIPSWKHLAKHIVLRHLFQQVDQFLYIGQGNRRFYEKYGARPNQLHRTPYAVDNERFCQQASALAHQRMAIRRGWGISDDAFCVLFCGKFIPKKRPSDIIEAARLVHKDGRIPNIHVLFVGSGELGEALRGSCSVVFDADSSGETRLASARENSWRPPASFAGFLNQTEISKAYVAADCMVLPSDFGETWGLVVNEAMASGLPCATSRACGCTEDLILPHWPERTFELGDKAGLANAIVSIFRCDHSSEAERRTVSSYSIQATLDQIARLYEAP